MWCGQCETEGDVHVVRVADAAEVARFADARSTALVWDAVVAPVVGSAGANVSFERMINRRIDLLVSSIQTML